MSDSSLYSVRYSEPVKRAQDGSDVTSFGSFDNSTSKGVLDLLEAGYLRLQEVVAAGITVVRFQ